MEQIITGAAIDHSDVSIFNPIPEYWDSLYWFVESEDTPYKTKDFSPKGWERYWSLLDEAHVDFPCLENRTTNCIRPGYFSKLFPLVIPDEWTSFTGVPCDDLGTLPEIAEAYVESGSIIGTKNISHIIRNQGVLLVHPSDWWEIYPKESISSIHSISDRKMVSISAERLKNFENSRSYPSPFDSDQTHS